MAKSARGGRLWAVAEMCVQTHGGFGFAEEFDIERNSARPALSGGADLDQFDPYLAEHVRSAAVVLNGRYPAIHSDVNEKVPVLPGHHVLAICVPTLIRRSEALQQPFDIFELELRAEVLAEAAAQFFQDATCALHVDLARHLHGDIVAVVAPAQRPPERIGLLLGARLAEPSRLAGTRAHLALPLLLLHRLRHALGAAAQRFDDYVAKGVDHTVLKSRLRAHLRLAHGVSGLAELVHFAALLPLSGLLAALALAGLLATLTLLALLALLTLLLAEAALLQLLKQLVELLLQRLLLLLQVGHALLALLAFLALLGLLAALTTLPLLSALALLVLTLLEGAVAQLLLLADHVAELVERVVLITIALLLAGLRHLQVLQHLLKLLEQLAGGIASAGAGHLLHAVDHVAQILRPHLPRIGIVRAGELLRIAAHLLGQRLHELVERRAQLVGEPLDLLVGGAALRPAAAPLPPAEVLLRRQTRCRPQAAAMSHMRATTSRNWSSLLARASCQKIERRPR
jgi:hypothetical protein